MVGAVDNVHVFLGRADSYSYGHTLIFPDKGIRDVYADVRQRIDNGQDGARGFPI